MEAETRQKIHLALWALVVIVALRTGYIFYERHQENAAPDKQEAPALKADYYVTPKKLHPFDLKSARELTQQPVWAREGYHYAYFPYDTTRKRSDFAHEAGTLGPLEKLEIKDVVTDITPGESSQRQVMAIFQKEGKSYSFPIGYEASGSFTFYSDDMLFVEDPHDLYKHWPSDVWDAISKHEVHKGMNQLQADFSLGFGTPDNLHDANNRTVSYANNGKPMLVTFEDDHAVEVKPGT